MSRSGTGKSVADDMRDRLRIHMHLAATPLGEKMAEEERPEMEEDIKEALPKLAAGDLQSVCVIVHALVDNRIVA